MEHSKFERVSGGDITGNELEGQKWRVDRYVSKHAHKYDILNQH